MRICTAVVLAIAVSVTAAAQSPTRRALATVDSIAAAEFAQDSVASLTIGVVTPQGLVWTKTYGFADMASRQLANRQSVYRIGSITKTFTALMLQQLMASGKIRLTDPIERYYPEIRQVNGYAAYVKIFPPITVLQVATMTAGLDREPRQEGPFWTGPVSSWDSTLRNALPHTGFAAAPGARFLYSNIGYAILGATLGLAAGVPYVQWQKEHVLAPLGLTHTAFEIEPAIAGNVTRGYDIARDGSYDPSQADKDHREGRGFKVPNGAIYTTIDDLSRFVALQLGGAPESVASHARLDSVFRSFIGPNGQPKAEYGLGFSVARHGTATWFGHGGAVAGYSASMVFDRERKLGVVVLRNALGGRVRLDQLAESALTRVSQP
jgi:D-alanyl-D-alanine carboxypeptidase